MSNTATKDDYKPSTINCTPTWKWAASIYIAVLQQKGGSGKEEAAKELMKMADHLDKHNEQAREQAKIEFREIANKELDAAGFSAEPDSKLEQWGIFDARNEAEVIGIICEAVEYRRNN